MGALTAPASLTTSLALLALLALRLPLTEVMASIVSTGVFFLANLFEMRIKAF